MAAKKKDSIQINPKNEGKFTDFAKEHHMTVAAMAGYVLMHKSMFSSGRIKQANFARNAKKWN